MTQFKFMHVCLEIIFWLIFGTGCLIVVALLLRFMDWLLTNILKFAKVYPSLVEFFYNKNKYKAKLVEIGEKSERLSSHMSNIVPDNALREAFEDTNFGSKTPRYMVNDALLKCAAGYQTGKTIKQIVIDLGLVHENEWLLTDKGKQYLYAANS